MKEFNKVANKVVDLMEEMARNVESDKNIKAYFIEAYDYLDGDDATHAVLRYIEDQYFG